MLSKLDLGLLIGATVILTVTKPSASDVERLVKEKIVAEVAATDIKASDGFLQNLATVACKLDADSCYGQIRPLVKIEYRSKLVVSLVGITVGGKKTNCIGAATKLFCPSFLNS